jgi:hypothetical protein
MNIITLLQLLVDSGAVSPKAPTRPKERVKSWFRDKDRSSGKGQGARVDLGLIRHFK